MLSEGFDRWARHYNDSALQPVYRAAHQALLQRLRQLASHPRRVLDIGCGTGRLLHLAAQHFPHALLVGVDKSEPMLSVADYTTSTPRRVLVQAGAERLPFSDRSFDLIISTASLRHWADPRAGIEEVRRVLAPDGLLGLADLTPARPYRARGWRRERGGLVDVLQASLARSGLQCRYRETADGFGPVPAITIVLATHVDSRSPKGYLRCV